MIHTLLAVLGLLMIVVGIGWGIFGLPKDPSYAVISGGIVATLGIILMVSNAAALNLA